ncbi:MAG: bacteriohopanetetrol glucosamine biosynthesis glycosyltransferase HpnI [Acidobacteria bacterium]|nr:bacteriohopanetetrol glucosamine biosynthesis glycosyltransferase HpnI [Acidobacteriota bacterium]
MKTFLLLCSLIVGSTLGEICSAKGMKQVGDVSFNSRSLLRAIRKMVRNPYLIAGVGFLAISFFSFLSLLSYQDLSFIVPLTAVTYLTNTLGARFFLKEKVSKRRWIGTILVAGGVLIVSISNRFEELPGGIAHIISIISPADLLDPEESPILFRSLFVLRLLLSALIFSAILYYLFALIAGYLWFIDRRKQRALGVSYTPPVTILKPVRGADADAYQNFASFCMQDYPEYQVIFGVQDAADPAVDVIKRLIADYPEQHLGLLISAETLGLNAKVSNLQNMYAQAKHEILLIADSDIRVQRDYLRRVVAPLRQPEVGMVTCLYRGVHSTTFASLLENIGITSTFGPEVCAARALEGLGFALGSTIVMRRETLERIGGFRRLADYLSDDFMLGKLTSVEGYRVVLSDYIVEHITGPINMASYLHHQLRWGRSIRISRPWGYRGLILTYGTATSLMALPAWNFAGIAWLVFAVTIFCRFLPALSIGVYGLKDYAIARYLYLVPLQDMIRFCLWLVSFTGNEIEWRGSNFRVLPGGKLAQPK